MRPAHRRLDEATRLAIKRMSDAELDAIIDDSPEGADWWHARTDAELEQMARSNAYPAHLNARPIAKDGTTA